MRAASPDPRLCGVEYVPGLSDLSDQENSPALTETRWRDGEEPVSTLVALNEVRDYHAVSDSNR